MSDETVPQPEDTVSRAEFNMLQEQLKATRVERDREKFEKAEIVAKANAFAKERDNAKQELASVLEARDTMIGDIVAEHEKKLADAESKIEALTTEKTALAASLTQAERGAADATRRAEAAEAEVANLRQELTRAPDADPLLLLWKLAQQKTKAAHDWLRARIPADSPALPWFDKTVAASLQIGCTGLKLSQDLFVWAKPRAIALSKKGLAKLEELVAKK